MSKGKEKEEKKLIIFRTTGYQNRQLKLIVKAGYKKVENGIDESVPTKRVKFKGGILALQEGYHDEEIEYVKKFMNTPNGRRYGIYIDKPKTKEDMLEELKQKLSNDAKSIKRLEAEIKEEQKKKEEEQKKKEEEKSKSSKK